MILANHGIISSSGGVSFDADALSFITAAAITDDTQKTAINTLVTDLKTYNIWTKTKAIYPFVGGTAAQHRFNLKDPRTINAAFYLDFNGGWTHSSTGALPNGTNGFAYTYLVPSVDQTLDSNGIGMYLGTLNTSASSDPIHMGVFNTVARASTVFINKSNTNINSRLNGDPISSSAINALGLISSQKTSITTTTLYKNSTIVGSGNSGGTLPIVQIALGNISASTSSTFSIYNNGWTNSEFRLSYISDGLDSTDMINLYNAVQTFQTTLGRQV
jgi:hypothetical protein